MKTKLNIEIHLNIRAILYLCELTSNKLEVVRELFFTDAFEALETYSNIPNPESQLVVGNTYEELLDKLEKLHKNMESKEWLEMLNDCM